MTRLYRHPKKIWLALLALTGLGLYLGWRLPVALYPESHRVEYNVELYLNTWTARDYFDRYGDAVYGTLRRIPHVEKLVTDGGMGYVSYHLIFEWGADPDAIKRSMEASVSQIRSLLPFELHKNLSFDSVRHNSAFFAASLFDTRPQLTPLYDRVAPRLLAQVHALHGVGAVEIDNPEYDRLTVTLLPERLASHRLSPQMVADFIRTTLASHDGGSMFVGGREIRVVLQNRVQDEESLKELSLESLGRPGLKLKDIARVELSHNATDSRIFRYNGKRSLILWVDPEAGGNIKELSQQVVKILDSIKKDSEVDYELLVNPSEFIGRAVWNVALEALTGGVLAVLILMLFVGSLRLTIYSSIEIPLALIWAFILMYLFDVSLNLISLGGLALTAGMNIDASVVMVENIVRHFKLHPPQTQHERMERVLIAVREVLGPLMSSTLITLIVFAPLSLTSGITYAILGDLAKTVIYSHGFSALVALLVVPTVRIYFGETASSERLAFFQVWLEKLEGAYEKLLTWICANSRRRSLLSLGCAVAVLTSVVGLYPFIRQEVIATPKTDSVFVSVHSTDLSSTEEFSQVLFPLEEKLLQEGKPVIQSVFTSIWTRNGGGLLVRLRSKKDLDSGLEKIKALLTNSPRLRFQATPWNPSELRLPQSADLTVKISGDEKERILEAQRIEAVVYKDPDFLSPETSLTEGQQLKLTPDFRYLRNLEKIGGPGFGELSQMVSLVLRGSQLGYLHTSKGPRPLHLRLAHGTASTPDDLGALPVLAGSYILPFRALVQLEQLPYTLSLRQENGKDLVMVQANFKESVQGSKAKKVDSLKERIKASKAPGVDLEFTSHEQEVRDSLQGLIFALILSMLLIAAVLYVQFESWLEVLIVMSAIPLGLLGASLSLFAAQSTWSLNSILGVIMLAGISVNNSILLVSFFNHQSDKASSPLLAAVRSSVVRLRPILITSLTTILAMLPIAFGLGEGGEVLQPLGIAVSGGMLFSTILTLFLIPALEVSFARSL